MPTPPILPLRPRGKGAFGETVVYVEVAKILYTPMRARQSLVERRSLAVSCSYLDVPLPLSPLCSDFATFIRVRAPRPVSLRLQSLSCRIPKDTRQINRHHRQGTT